MQVTMIISGEFGKLTKEEGRLFFFYYLPFASIKFVLCASIIHSKNT